MQITLGVTLAAIVAAFAYRARALSAGGAAAGFAVGTVVFARGGWAAAAVLFAFFLPSSALSRIGVQRKRAIGDPNAHRARGEWQVLANGGVAALCILIQPRGGTAFAAGFAGAFAAAAADTWGTEIGTLSRGPTVSILTLQPLPAGLSGGVTALGLAATVAGALAVAVVASCAGVASVRSVATAGIAGALLDSVLGASLQARRWCPKCACECETRRHTCGVATLLRRGASWLENDGVNFAATLCGATVAGVITSLSA
ncbi:MAG: DUF92 domain-containing protein [Candidatus Eremiobacteraeota bacterium]|nr:DUF92 domain-containing protein [Candidatus Eremiobacteraeota bacterium]